MSFTTFVLLVIAVAVALVAGLYQMMGSGSVRAAGGASVSHDDGGAA